MTQQCNCHGNGGYLSQTVAAVLERPRYSPGLILEDRDLTAAVEYTRDLNRLLFRNLFGCGVICGLIVKVDEHCGLRVTVGAGLALDGCGDAVQVPKPVVITVDERKVDEWKREWESPKNPDRNRFWIVLCGKEKFCEPRTIVCDSDDVDGGSQPTRIRSQAEVTITLTKPECVCQCASPTPATNGNADPTGRRTVQNPSPDENGDDCQVDHNTHVECVSDCGCGTACTCGCCVLLAEVEFGGDRAAPGDKWKVHHQVRRLVRPAMLRDPQPRNEEPQAPAPAAAPEATAAAGDAPVAGGEAPATNTSAPANADEGPVVAYQNGRPLRTREVGELLVGYFTKESKPRSLKLQQLGIDFGPAAPAANTGSPAAPAATTGGPAAPAATTGGPA